MSYSSYTPSAAQPNSSYYSSTPPAPPPKPGSTDQRAPPLPPPRGHPTQHEPLELDANGPRQQQYQYEARPTEHHQTSIPPIEAGWLPKGVRDKAHDISVWEQTKNKLTTFAVRAIFMSFSQVPRFSPPSSLTHQRLTLRSTLLRPSSPHF